jgi:multidrug efflux pump subunit AcrA (membrane-fusion protein)
LKKWIITIIILVILIGGGTWFYLIKGQNQNPVLADTTPIVAVQKGNLNVKISGSGSIESASTEDVKASSNAEVDEVLVAKNDTVTKGQELVTFTDGSDPIIAPIKGTITSLDVESGEKLNNGKVVSHITNYNELETTIKVDELDISKIKNGQSAEVTANAFPETTYKGKVTDVAREGDVSNGVSTFNVTVHLTSPKNLKVGMTTEAKILTASKMNILYVPVEAVHTNGNQKFVLVKGSRGQQGTSSKVVKTGINNDSYVEITSGLTEGEQVQLPAIAKSSTNIQSNKRGFGGMGGMGGMNRGNWGSNGGGTRNGNGGGN